jgi:hypothetical protein
LGLIDFLELAEWRGSRQGSDRRWQHKCAEPYPPFGE